MSLPRALLFDFDGTLIDSAATICSCFNEALGKLGFPSLEELHIREMIGRPLREMFWRATHCEDAKQLDVLVMEYRKAFGPLTKEVARPVPGVSRLIPRWAISHKLAIVTSRTGQGTILILDCLGLQRFFSAVVGIEDVKCCKPDPEPVQLALQILGVEPSDALMIGDTTQDILAARAAGVPALGFSLLSGREKALKEAGALAVFSNFEELERLVGG